MILNRVDNDNDEDACTRYLETRNIRLSFIAVSKIIRVKLRPDLLKPYQYPHPAPNSSASSML